MTADSSPFTIHPLTSARWDDFERLFGANGACAGCWCMFARQTRAEFDRLHGQANKEALRAIVEHGEVPGLLAYAAGVPVGWCSVAPQSAYPSILRSRILTSVDNEPTWSVVCFFVPRAARGQGVTRALLRAALRHAQANDAHVVEGYPVDPAGQRLDNASAWHGVASTFREVGFTEVARRAPRRPIMRFLLESRAHDI
jgi:GNAT superfamily N-acetyltransferase